MQGLGALLANLKVWSAPQTRAKKLPLYHPGDHIFCLGFPPKRKQGQ